MTDISEIKPGQTVEVKFTAKVVRVPNQTAHIPGTVILSRDGVTVREYAEYITILEPPCPYEDLRHYVDGAGFLWKFDKVDKTWSLYVNGTYCHPVAYDAPERPMRAVTMGYEIEENK